ncbi:MAG: flagellar biosynthetic protein FliQ [Pseudomonadota bacterium]
MGEAAVIALMREAVWVGVVIAMPILVVALVTGLVIGLFQALTSVQELTLTFVPKLAAILIVFVLTLGFMLRQLVGLFQDGLIPAIVAGG